MKQEQLPYFVLIDDDEDDRFVMREALEESGCDYQLVEFEDGTRFLRYLQEKSQHEDIANLSWLVIMDFHLPGLDAFEILPIMRQHALWKSIPVIILSGSTDPRLAKRAAELGATDFVVKPLTVKELARHINEVFGPCLEQHIATMKGSAGVS